MACHSEAGPNLSAERALALAASSSRFFGAEVVSSDRSKRSDTSEISSIAARNEASFAFDGFVKPLIFLTNCNEAARTSPGVTGGSKLKRGLMFLHMKSAPNLIRHFDHPRKLGPLLILGDHVAFFRAGEAALRTQAELVHVNKFRSLINAALEKFLGL